MATRDINLRPRSPQSWPPVVGRFWTSKNLSSARVLVVPAVFLLLFLAITLNVVAVLSMCRGSPGSLSTKSVCSFPYITDSGSGSGSGTKSPLGGASTPYYNGNSDPDPDSAQELFAIDAVVTFVNGSDPIFRSQLISHADEVSIPYAVTDSRFHDNEDLKYLLRSLDVYGQIFRYIFVVVAYESQVPVWLNRDNPKIKIVYHRDIWLQPSQLPVFNSLAIESSLHHIPQLSEAFVYFNDDIALVNELFVEDFLWISPASGKVLAIQVRCDDLTLPERASKTGTDSHWVGPAIRVKMATQDLCGNHSNSVTYGKMPKHTPHLLLKSVMTAAERDPRFADLFAFTAASRFRNGREQHTVMLFNAYAECALNLTTILGERKELAYVGVNKGHLDAAYYGKMVRGLNLYSERIKTEAARFICLNDVNERNNVTLIGSKAAELAYKWRAAMFPDKSAFEL